MRQWISRGKRSDSVVVADAPFFHRARLEVLDQDVGAFQQAQQHRAAVGLADVERDGALVAVDADEVAGVVVVERRAPVAHLVALRRLDLDHVGAVVGQDHRAVRAAEHARQVDHLQAGQRARRTSPGPCPGPPAVCVASFIGLSAPCLPRQFSMAHGPAPDARDHASCFSTSPARYRLPQISTRAGRRVARQRTQRIGHVRSRPRDAARGLDDRLDRPRVVLARFRHGPQCGCKRNQRPQELGRILRLLHADDQMHRPIRPGPQMLGQRDAGAGIVAAIEPQFPVRRQQRGQPSVQALQPRRPLRRGDARGDRASGTARPEARNAAIAMPALSSWNAPGSDGGGRSRAPRRIAVAKPATRARRASRGRAAAPARRRAPPRPAAPPAPPPAARRSPPARRASGCRPSRRR